MSVNVDIRVAGPGDTANIREAWRLKERIRRREGVLKQRRGFFMDAYRRATVHQLLVDGEVVGFSATRRDGYILFLAVHPEYRGRGFGRRLVELVDEDHATVTCHARTTNRNALEFYERLGFEVVRRVNRYYEDDGDAFYLKRGGGESLGDRLSKYLHR